MRYFPVMSAIWLAAFPVLAQAVAEKQIDLPELGSERILPEERPAASRKATPLVTLSAGGEIGTEYSSNVFRENADEDADMAVIAAPSLRLRGRNAEDTRDYDVRLELESGQFMDFNENDYLDGRLRGVMTSELRPAVKLEVTGSLAKEHVGIGAFSDEPDSQLSEVTNYIQAQAGAAVAHRTSNWMTRVGADVVHLDYDNVRRRDGVLRVNDDRDMTEMRAHMRVGYQLQHALMPYVQVAANRRRYVRQIDDTAIDGRDSDGLEMLTGLMIGNAENDVLTADVAVGWLRQDYDAAAREDISGMAAMASFDWKPSTDWRVRGGLSRRVRETTLSGASGFMQTRVTLQTENQLTERITLESMGRYTLNDFEVSPGVAAREDHVVDVELVGKYHLSEPYYVALGMGGQRRDSDNIQAEFSALTGFVNLGAEF